MSQDTAKPPTQWHTELVKTLIGLPICTLFTICLRSIDSSATHRAVSKDCNQTVQMCLTIWVFVVNTGHFRFDCAPTQLLPGCVLRQKLVNKFIYDSSIQWAASSEFGTYRVFEQWRFRRACASAQSRQNLRCSLIQAVSQEEPSDRKPDLWTLWMAGHAQLKFVITECPKTQICLTRHTSHYYSYRVA